MMHRTFTIDRQPRSHRSCVMPASRVSAAAVLIALTAACGNDVPSGASTVADFPDLELIEELRLGSVSDPDIGFSQPAGLDVDRDGDLWVLEISAGEIRVYGEDGTLKRRFGGRGEGPGEFQGPSGFGVTGDTEWAFDRRLRRITLFDRRGNLLTTAPLQTVEIPLWTPGSRREIGPSILRSDGLFASDMALVLSGSLAGQPLRSDPDAPAPNDTVMIPRLLFGTDGQIADTVGFIALPPPPPQPQTGSNPVTRIELEGRRYSIPRPFPDDAIQLPLAMGYIVIDRTAVASAADDATFRATRLSDAGDTLYDRRFRYQPRRYTDAVLDSLARQRATGAPGLADASAVDPAVERATNAIREAMDFPEFMPPIFQAWPGRDGSVRLALPTVDAWATEWLLIDPDGQPIGRLDLPGRQLPVWLSADRMWVMEFDDMDIPWLVRYRFAG